MRVKTITQRNISAICREIAASDETLARVVATHGAPPLWDRKPGFATLLRIILEQQVSLASAKACFDKLAARIGDVTPEGLLTLDDDELRSVGFSRQKTSYGRDLAQALLDERIDLDGLHRLPDDEARAKLTTLKGVGRWTSDIYLLMALLRPDVMPRGDIALHEAYRRLNNLDRRPDSDDFLAIAERWQPFRSVAARLLWHFYLSEKFQARVNIF